MLLPCLRVVLRIFYSLNWLDLPEYFEDHMQEWMALHLKYLKYKNALVEDDAEVRAARWAGTGAQPCVTPERAQEDEPGPVERVRAAVVQNISHYAQKYDEDFEPFFATFSNVRLAAKPVGPVLALCALADAPPLRRARPCGSCW